MRSVSITPRILYFGTPVVLLSTSNPDGTPNLAPLSSAWALSWTVVLGLTRQARRSPISSAPENAFSIFRLRISGKRSSAWHRSPARIRRPNGLRPTGGGRFEPDKLGAAELTPLPSECVGPPRLAECPLQLEAVVRRITPLTDDQLMATVEARVLRAHAHSDIMADQGSHVDPERWHPLIYNFRHYFGLGPELGRSFRATTPGAPQARRGP